MTSKNTLRLRPMTKNEIAALPPRDRTIRVHKTARPGKHMTHVPKGRNYRGKYWWQ